MEVLDKLNVFNSDIQEAKKVLQGLMDKRIKWCRDNSKEIKKLYPTKNKIYRLNNINSYHRRIWSSGLKEDEIYFFKAKDTRFSPHRDFDRNSGDEKPTVLGTVLDYKYREVMTDMRVPVEHLTEVIEEKAPEKLSDIFTKVYVMIDKNTGFYKIGRSKNPGLRERTLQSEKPTIEMLFFHDARVKDEKELHEMFEEKRVRGEWFDLSGTDLLKIREYFSV